MSDYRWNREHTHHRFWDLQEGKENPISRSDLNFIKNPIGGKFEDIIAAICRVVAELVEIEEKRGK